MKKSVILLIFNLLCFFTSTLFAQMTDTNLREILNFINKDSLKKTVQDLQNFDSRLCSRTTGDNKNVAQYLVNRLKAYKIENAQIDSFYVKDKHWAIGKYEQYMFNVSGTLIGTGDTDSTVIFGAHLDAISLKKPENILTEFVPGADDNATGCAVMIEMARIIHEKKLKPHHNIAFMAYDGEEVGLEGSFYDAKKRKAANENIIVMLNNDMVGNQPDDKKWEVSLRWYDNSLDVTEKAEQALTTYTTVTPVRAEAPNSSNSDSYAYYAENYKANFAIEQNFSPYYHTANDLTEFLNFAYCRQIARMNFVLLAHYAIINIDSNAMIENNKPHPDIELYPNPAYDFITIHSYNDVTVNKVDICDLSGKKVKTVTELKPQQNSISLDNLSRGVYVVRVYTDKHIIHKKIIKQ